MPITEFTAALNQVAAERNISTEEVIATLKEALVAAYMKDHPIEEEEIEKLSADIDSDSGEVKVFFDKKDVTPAGFGRIASQTAKQVILQKIREAEKESIANEYRELIGTIVPGYIFRIDKDTVIMDVGKTQGILPFSEQIPNERYSVNQKYKVLVKEVTDKDEGGSAIILSRKDPRFIEELFKQEVPEIESGVVKIEEIAREAGERTKVAVSSSDDKVDPSGACIGQRGIRVQAVTDELNGEKIDIINYHPSPDKFIALSLSPAHVVDIMLNEEEHSAVVIVSEDQLSLAIGNHGQNARLAAKLTGWRININGPEGSEKKTEGEGKEKDRKNSKDKAKDEKESKSKTKKPVKTAKKEKKGKDKPKKEVSGTDPENKQKDSENTEDGKE
ncbi:transcription termination factor NusA [candidate division WWE3 bacterium RIFCSPLOWO2_01_FULL_39_13]|uniref:Transcription termination/antitermination protein NusA n=1 Tax=candidate division WWE3 bacterium RIFCSPLOWO2_01_FULL_39_13 TaxID=1802624 RepID=A0A1F4V582_UNCKA|nr:MAG: transcription termination factor NusA [candidate division WWE3 bacterium RIFCSPLOWO2_01_FULL_39_13]